MIQLILTTLCYIRKEDEILMLYRNKKENDINEGKWVGVGGKLEEGESPEECVIREVLEETGLTIKNPKLKAYITFPKLYYGQDEGMFLFVCDNFSGTIHECNEGTLAWVKEKEILQLPLWQGDHYFFDWIKEPRFTTAKMIYQDDQLVDVTNFHY